MAEQRLPLARYRRQLREMRTELTSWIAAYEETGRRCESLGLAGRYAKRAAALEDVRAAVFEAEMRLYEVPRVQ